mmetsp:Transcript_20035/g.41714  ORF Transcript_20035/g.41714 Transcript_20035/m.41714 type:complete len:295 (-) Transcript_20035:166-1050(-)
MTTLLLIDVQKDFHPGGSLAIPSASQDAERIARFIRENATSIQRIVATMDSHHKLHIAHPSFWTNAESGKHPDPFTVISMEDVKSGTWIPRKDLKFPVGRPLVEADVFTKGGEISSAIQSTEEENFDILQYCIEYTRRLEEKGRFQLCIWPEHCLIGTEGHNIVDDVRKALDYWSGATGGNVEWVIKGENLLTEMYSALRADVPLTMNTDFNQELFESLRKSVKLVVCGQAMSHCVNYTVRDIVEHWPKEEMGSITLLKDCASSVPGFESAGEAFLSDMEDVGVNLESAATFQF